MTRHVALFRGINVGGHNRVPMARLREVFESLGCDAVGSVIQSGNIVFDYDNPATAADFEAELEEVVWREFEVRTPVTLRSSADFTAALEAHPFSAGEIEPKYHHIMFLKDDPPEDAAARLESRADGDGFAVIGREVHVVYRNGSARARLTVAWVDRQLDTVATARNLSTCAKVRAVLEA